MKLRIHTVVFIAAYLGGAMESRSIRQDPHHIDHWWQYGRYNNYRGEHDHIGEHYTDHDGDRYRYAYQGPKQRLPKFFYGISTPYRLLGKPPLRTRRPSGQCEAVQLYMLFRHGERYRRESPGFNVPDIAPLEETINRLIKNTTGISPTVNVKFPYKNPFLIKEEGLLMPEGDKQIYTIGRRMAKRYPELFPGRFSVADLNFTSSCFLRASQTASAFGLGYLQGKGNVTRKRLQPIPLVTFIPCGDRLNHPVAGCPKWVKTVSTNPDTFIESSKFIKSERFKRVVIKVREKLGLRDVDEVDEQLVRLMFEACAWGIQRAGATDDTEWCSVFDTEDQKVYDYFVDLDFYNIHGPGRQISLDVSCGQLQDIVMNLESMAGRISGKPKSRFVGRFGHLNTIGCLVQKLGLFRDRLPVLADNFEQLRDRNFHIGHIGPMSGNVAVVLFSCSHGEQYRVQFFHNERLIKLPFCHSKVDCSLDEFVNHIKMLLKTCNYDEVCRL